MDTSPKDLAVAFRALPRRRKEALGDVHRGHPGVVAHVERLDGLVARAAAVVKQPPDHDAVADELASRPASSWNEHELSILREVGLAMGATLRELAAAAEALHDD